jgi:hypothetical protein
MKRKHQMHIGKIVSGAALIVAATLLWVSLPDIRRYIRISTM